MTAERSPQSGLPVFVEGCEGQVRPDDEALNTLASDGFTDGFRDPFTACDREVTIGLARVGEAQPFLGRLAGVDGATNLALSLSFYELRALVQAEEAWA